MSAGDQTTLDPGNLTGAGGDGGGDTGVAGFADIVLPIIYIMLGCIGLLANSFMVGVLGSSAKMRKKVQNIYLINQGCIDALASVFIAAYAISSFRTYKNLQGLADDILCRLWLTRFPNWSVVMTSTYNLMGLTLDRYFRIVHPIKYKNHFKQNMMIPILVFIWLVGPLYNLSWKLPTSGLIDGECYPFRLWPSDLTQTLVGVLTVIIEYFLPLFTLAYCYIRMIFIIRGRLKPQQGVIEVKGPEGGGEKQVGGAAATANNNSTQNNFNRAKNNIIKTLMMVAAAFVLCWTCNEFFILFFFLGYPTDFSSAFYHFTVVMVFANSCINPIIYCAKYDEFHQQFKHLFCKNRIQNNDSDTVEETVG